MSSKGLGKPLTTELVFTKTKSDSLHNIKNLNLWGNDLQDLSLIQKMPNLEVVSLSVNRISTLKQFANCQKLQELYLRKNNITDLREIKYLLKLPVLKVLWLHDNPCAQVQNYRQIVIKYLPNLMKLDNNPVTPQDKINSQKITYNLGIGGGENNYKSQAQSVTGSSHQSYSQQYNNNNKNNNKNYSGGIDIGGAGIGGRGQQQQKWGRPSTAQSNSSKKGQPLGYDQRIIGAGQRNISSAQSGVGSNISSSHSSYQQQQYGQGHGQGGHNYSQAQQQQPQYGQQKWNKKPTQGSGMHRKSNPDHSQDYISAQINMNRNQNILMAILSLMRQLDVGSLEIVRRQADKMLDQR